ncbi:MAG: two-component regulator propeller domain-containing protein [Proteiniphilum sp.]
MVRKKITWIFLLLGFLSPLFSNSSKYYFTKISIAEGLSQSNVKSICQDSMGFMWFGTRNKLNRYDGVSMKIFDVVDEQQSITNNNIGALLEDSERKLWVGTDKGIFIFDPFFERFRFFDLKTDEGIQITNWVSDIKMDADGNIWIVIPGQGLFLYIKTDRRLEYFAIGSYEEPDQGNPQCLYIGANGSVWIGTNGGGVYLYDKDNQRFTQYLGNAIGSNTLSGQNIYTIAEYGDELVIGIHEGKLLKLHKRRNILTEFSSEEVNYKIIRCIATINDQLWVGTQYGLFIIDEKNNSTTHLTESFVNPYSISNNVIEKIYQDKEGGVWIGTYSGGLSYLSNQGMHFEKYIPTLEKGSISCKQVSILAEDHLNRIWVGTDDRGVSVFYPETGKFIQFPENGNMNALNQRVISILLQPDKAWIGYFKNGIDLLSLSESRKIHYSGKDLQLNEASPFALCEDRHGNIWLGNGWGVYLCDDNSMKFKHIEEFGSLYVFDILEDSNGSIWVASMGGGVAKYDPVTSEIKWYRNDMNEPKSISSNSVSSITETSDGTVWFSTDRGGISRYNKDSDDFTSFSIKQGLPDDVAYKIVEDENNNLWFGTNRGLVHFNPVTESIRVFTRHDGLLSNQFAYKSGLSAKSGKLYFGNNEGMIAFEPSQFTPNTYNPPVYITSININNRALEIGVKDSTLDRSIVFTDKIRLKHDQSNISIDFAALSFTAPQSNRYAYKMEGLDNEWNFTNHEHSISYSKLPPGNYIFRVKGSNNDGLWNDSGQSLIIDILPPWWQSSVAKYTYFFLFLISLILFLVWNDRRQKKKHLARQKLFEVEKEKELYDSKIEFFSNVAHEIKTPLTLINGPLESLKEMQIENSEINKNIDIIEDNTNQLILLINQLLDFRKIDNKNFAIHLQLLNINQFLREVFSKFELIASRKNKRMELQLPDKEFEIPVDRDGVMKILNNLFLNAIKYSDSEIMVTLTEINPDRVAINVSNDGSKIPLEKKEKIFEVFYQLDSAKSSPSGSGIGLSLSRAIARLHNGDLYLDGNVIGANSFVLELPKVQEKEVWISDQTVNYETQDNREEYIKETNVPTILYVEDNEDVLSFVSEKFRKSEFTVLNSSNGKDAIKLLENNSVDIIISDVMMPEMNGFELCSHVKNTFEYCHIPIILLTAKNDIESKIDGLTAGAEVYIEKPFSYEYLLAQIRTILNNRMMERKAFLQRPSLPVQQTGMNKADEEFLEKVMNIITGNITDPDFGVEKLSELVYMSRSSLHRKIKALTDITPTDFIRVIRLKKAAELIRERNYRTNEVCYLVGINSPTYFNKLFQKQFNMTPKEYSDLNLS